MSHQYSSPGDTHNTDGAPNPWSRVRSFVPEDPIIGFPGSSWALRPNETLPPRSSLLAPSPNATRPNSTSSSLHRRNRSAVDQLAASVGSPPLQQPSADTACHNPSPAQGSSALSNDPHSGALEPDARAFAHSYFRTRLPGPYTNTNLQPQTLQVSPSTGAGSAYHESQNTGASWWDGLKDASSTVASGVASGNIHALKVLKDVLTGFNTGIERVDPDQTYAESNVVKNIHRDMGRDTYRGSKEAHLSTWQRVYRLSKGVLTSMGQPDETAETEKAMQKELTQTKNDLSKARKSNGSLKQEVSQAHTSRMIAEEALGRKERTLREWEEKSLANDAEIKSLSSEIQTLTSRCTDAETKVEKLQDEVKQLERELEGGVPLDGEEWGSN